MPNGFFKCPEGIAAYTAIGKEYDNTLDDTRYENILKITANSPHSGRNTKTATVMVRLLADDGNEYLKYDLHEIRYDSIGAFHEVYAPNIGTYPKPVTQPSIQLGADMTTHDVVNGPIVRIDTGFLIPFTAENVDNIHQMANMRTQYITKRQTGGQRFTVKKYEDFRDKPFVELETGKPATSDNTLDKEEKQKVTRSK